MQFVFHSPIDITRSLHVINKLLIPKWCFLKKNLDLTNDEILQHHLSVLRTDDTNKKIDAWIYIYIYIYNSNDD
jgi:hypothetical protein